MVPLLITVLVLLTLNLLGLGLLLRLRYAETSKAEPGGFSLLQRESKEERLVKAVGEAMATAMGYNRPVEHQPVDTMESLWTDPAHYDRFMKDAPMEPEDIDVPSNGDSRAKWVDTSD